MFLVEMIYLWEKVIKQIKDAFGPIKRINNIDLWHKFYVLSTLYSIVKAASIWSSPIAQTSDLVSAGL